ncbi:carbohydrate ABC transporter permease [Planococcus citreus]|uniref:Carbohydrate ABC transporter membrane protein 1 (CUT1 family) n=1 Tax=Planococcus citreus TaxID=1373 RepID=A0A497YS41_9BACL|nr:sugar ABC transporter permease [Planococcus citreus]RLJ91153.1 carbohydrate ABC transporter membrane protein 1 (CUT1 family) [Planococcus citreus]
MAKPKSTMRRKETMYGYIFVMPWIIGFLAFTAGPLLFSLFASFTNYNITSQMDFVGAENYQGLFTEDGLFWTSLWNTLYYVLFSVPLTTMGAIFLSALLNQDVPGIRVFRTLYYLPAVLSGVGVYLLWMQLLDPGTGMINLILGWVGIDGPNWLFDPAWTKPSLIFMKLWSVGGAMLLYLASMQGVSKTLYEAAAIDGANTFRQFFHITLPMITPVIFFDVVTSLIGGFQIFQEAYVMSSNGEGGPANSLLFYNLYMWRQAFENFNMGYAMAMSWILFIIVFILTMINLKLAPRWVHYEGGDNR